MKLDNATLCINGHKHTIISGELYLGNAVPTHYLVPKKPTWRDKIRANWKNVVYLARHKWFVFKACWAMRYMRNNPMVFLGLVHDWSKLLPDEWFAYSNYFAEGGFEATHSEKAKADFDRAWLQHQKRNKHHWQYWVLINDTDPRTAVMMPSSYVIEMICDWWGAGAAQGHPNDVTGWYTKNKDKMILHPATRQLVEYFVARIDKVMLGGSHATN